jgi:hypothetical protein
MPAMKTVPAKLVRNECPECFTDLVAEAGSGGFAIQGVVGIIPDYWVNRICPHGRKGLRFELQTDDTGVLQRESQRAKSDEIELEVPDSRMDVTKDIGYPVREHGPYGSHSMQDDFDDESSPDGSGIY